MARPRSPEPKKVLKRHSDGTTWAYFYDRDTKRQVRKEQIGGEQPPAKPGPAKGSIAALVADYKASNGFTGARPRTQEVYTGTLNQIVAILGNDAAKDITPARIQILMQEYKDQPYKANDLVSILSILFSYAIKNWPGFSVNPAANPEKYHEEPRTQIWSEEAERVYGEQLRPSLRLLFGLLLYTLQRLSDVLEMTKDQVVDHKGRLYIVLVQQKTGALMSIPVHANLEAPLRERLATKIMHDGTECKNLIASPQGHPWTRRNASRAWDHDIAEARANRVEELRETGLSDAAIILRSTVIRNATDANRISCHSIAASISACSFSVAIGSASRRSATAFRVRALWRSSAAA